MKLLPILLLTACNALCAEKWESADGKILNADFVRLQGETLTLSNEGKQINLPLARLSKKSQSYARFMQEQMKAWVDENLEAPVIAENVIQDITAFDSSLSEGKNFLMEGKIKSIAKTSSLGASPLTTAAIELEGGTRIDIDLAKEADGKTTKVRIDKDRAVLTKGRNYDGGKWKDFVETEVLMEKGQTFVFHASVEKGKIKCSGVASDEDVDKAKKVDEPKRPAELTAADKAALGRLRMRAAYLESQLENKDDSEDGVLSDPSENFTKAELGAMRKELESIKKRIEEAEE